MKCVYAMLLTSVAAWAQAPAATFRVAGFLTDSITGEPVRRAVLSLDFLTGPQSGPARQTTTADAGGHFEFTGTVAGIYQLWAARRGYDRQNLAGPDGLRVVADSPDLLLRMVPYAALTGKVVDENDDPIAGAAIQLIQSSLESGKRELRPGPSAVTNDRGEYRVSSLPGGRYFVSAYARSQEASENTAYSRRFFPGAPDLRTAAALELEAGGNQHADFHLVPEPIFHIRGQVAGHERLSNISVALAPRITAEQFGGVSFQVRYLGEGRFDIAGIAPGQYVLTASAYEANALRRGSQIVVVSSADLEGVTVTPQPSPALTAHLTVEGQEGIEVPVLKRVEAFLLPEDSIGNAAVKISLDSAATDVKLTAQPGDYTLSFRIPEPYYVKSAVVGGLDALTGPMVVPQAGGLPPIEVVLAANGGEVTGTVKLQDQPAPKCLVMLIRKGSASPSQDKLAQTDQNGRFLFKGVAPGDYTAYAWRDIMTVEFRNPQALVQYSGTGVTVAEGSKQTVELKLNVN